jgi:hypothetical protein
MARGNGGRVPGDGQAVDRRPARVAEAEEAGHLVEGLTRGVIDGGSQNAVAPVALHGHQHGVASRDQQRHQGGLDRRVLEERRVEVGLEVVDGDEGDVPHQGQCLGAGQADQQRAHQTWSVGGGHCADVRPFDARLHQRLRHHRGQQLDVGPAGDLRNHSTEAGMEVDLAGNHRGAHVTATGHDRRRRLVTARLDAEYQ